MNASDAHRDPRELTRDDFDHLVVLGTRWSDNDAYGHLNNAVYLQLFDTAITGWLERGTGAAVGSLSARGVAAETRCRYFRPVSFPNDVHVTVHVERVGRTSVTYRLGAFAADETRIAALGHWVHVYVAPQTGRPAPVPDEIRRLLEAAPHRDHTFTGG